MSVIYCHGCNTHVDTDYHPSFVTIDDEEVCEDCAPACEECNEILEVHEAKFCDDCAAHHKKRFPYACEWKGGGV